MNRLITAGALLALSLSLVAVAPHPSYASWSGDHCAHNTRSDTGLKRSEARAYGDVADNEGYEWGGGCWNDDNKDDTPGQPDSGGEGPDCSGLVFKSWELKNDYGVSGFRWYDKMEDVHGPYAAADFHSPSSSAPFFRLKDKNRSTTLYMDGFASTSHIGLINTNEYPSQNTDYILEAYDDQYGTDVNERSYRGDSDFTGVRRENWTADCSPHCAASGAPAATVVTVP